jgi:hypothetical protein
MYPSVTNKVGRRAASERRRPWALAWRRGWLVLILVLFATLIPSDGYLGAARIDLVASEAIGPDGFRLGAWEVQALGQKLHDAFTHPGEDLSPAQQHDLVVAYFDAIAETDRLAGQIERIHADPHEPNPASAAAPLQSQLDALRRQQEARRPAVERILEDQVSAALADEGLTTAGHVFPPVIFQFTESPDILIISPRTHIVMEKSVYVTPGQPVTTKERIEGQVASRLGVSTLVDGTGGFSAYPTMVVQYADLSWVLDTIAHEWTHTYLAFRPLGQHYFDNGDTRTLNETTASMVGNEVGEAVLRRYYPERVAPPTPPSQKPNGSSNQDRPAEFQYGQTMRETRLRVDALLRQGRVAEAEAYMEAQRKVFVSHGYVIRKLNQAFFAFHGSYAVGPAATDPIGDKLRALRSRNPTLQAFVQKVAQITTVRELDALLNS